MEKLKEGEEVEEEKDTDKQTTIYKYQISNDMVYINATEDELSSIIYLTETIIFKKENIRITPNQIIGNYNLNMIQFKQEDYKLIEIISDEGNARVEKVSVNAYGLGLKFYAIKYIHFNQSNMKNILKNEIKILATTKSPYLVKCYSGFYRECYVGLVMELMERGSLRKIISLHYFFDLL